MRARSYAAVRRDTVGRYPHKYEVRGCRTAIAPIGRPCRVRARCASSSVRSEPPLCYHFHRTGLLDLGRYGIDLGMDDHLGMTLLVGCERAQPRDIPATTRERRVLSYRHAAEERFAA
jgi:hypothetical protein